MRKTKNLINQIFNKLTIKECAGFTNTKTNRKLWKCQCECGQFCIVSGFDLMRNHTKSCGCLSTYTGGKYISGKQFASLRGQAKRRKIEFTITLIYIEKIFEQQNKLCKYTKIPIYFDSTRKNGIKINGKNKILAGTASIDRKDSKKGYVEDNIQIVHKDVNLAKHIKSDEEFIKMCHLIAKNNPL